MERKRSQLEILVELRWTAKRQTFRFPHQILSFSWHSLQRETFESSRVGETNDFCDAKIFKNP